MRARFTKTFSCTGRTSHAIVRGIVEGIYRLHKKTIKPEMFFEHVPQPDFIRERLEQKEEGVLEAFAERLSLCPGLRATDPKVASRMTYEVLERLIHRYLTHFTHELDEELLLADLLYCSRRTGASLKRGLNDRASAS
jgi:hypothetical protein